MQWIQGCVALLRIDEIIFTNAVIQFSTSARKCLPLRGGKWRVVDTDCVILFRELYTPIEMMY